MLDDVEEENESDIQRYTRSASKEYSLDIGRAVRKKLKSCKNFPATTVKSSNKGQCLTISFSNTIQYEFFKKAAILLYENLVIENRLDKQGACVEVLISTPQVTIHLYNTNNKVLVQGITSDVLKWSNEDLHSLLSSLPPLVSSSECNPGLNLYPSSAVSSSTDLDRFTKQLGVVDAMTAPGVPTSNYEVNDSTLKALTVSQQGIDVSMPASPLPMTNTCTDLILFNQSPPISKLPSDDNHSISSKPETEATPTISMDIPNHNNLSNSPNSLLDISPTLTSTQSSNGDHNSQPLNKSMNTQTDLQIDANFSSCCSEAMFKCTAMQDSLFALLFDMFKRFECAIMEEQINLKFKINFLKKENESLLSRIDTLKNINPTNKTTHMATQTIAQDALYEGKQAQATTSVDDTELLSKTSFPIEVKITNRFNALQDIPLPGIPSSLCSEPTSLPVMMEVPNDLGNERANNPWHKQKSKRSRPQPRPVPPHTDHIINGDEERQTRPPTDDSNPDHVILGDSIVNGIHSNKMAATNELVSVLPFPGAGFFNIISKANDMPINAHAKKVTVHLGINDSMNNIRLSLATLSEVKSFLSKKLPNASLFISGIIPPYYGPQRHRVDENNKTLVKFCERNKCVFIDNVSFFSWFRCTY
jgi:hypothetical protein